MALAKQIGNVSFAQGLAQNLDPKQVVAGRFLAIENCRWDKEGRVRKRYGYDRLGPALGTIYRHVGRALAQYRDELFAFDGEKGYSYDSRNGSWYDKGAVPSVAASQTPIVRTTGTQWNPDFAECNGLQLFVWDGLGGVWAAVRDATTGLFVYPPTLQTAGGMRPKAAAIGNHLVLFYVINATESLYRVNFNVATPGTPEAPVLVTNSMAVGQCHYDVCTDANGNKLFVVYNKTGSLVALLSIDKWLVVSTEETMAGAATLLSVSILANGYGNVFIASYSGTGTRFAVYTQTLAQAVPPTAIETIANVVSITAASVIADPIPLYVAQVYYTISAAAKSNYLVRKVTVTGATPGTPAVWNRSVGLAGKAFAYGAKVYVPVVYDSIDGDAWQDTYFVMNEDTKVIARILSGNAGGHVTSSLLPESSVVGDVVSFACRAKTLLTTDVTGATPFYSTTGVNLCSLDFGDAQRTFGHAEMARTLFMAGACPQAYDGDRWVEDGFHVFPGKLTCSGSSGAYSSQYVAVYEWTDAQGQLHRSCTSVAATQLQAAPIDSGHAATITVPTLRITDKTNVSVVLYRTLANIDVSSQVFYRVSSIASPTLSVKTADTVSFTDAVTDAALVAGAQLYTTGGVLENAAPPPTTFLAIHQGRLYAVHAEDPLTLWYSKMLVPGWPVEWSDYLTIPVDARGGGVTGLASLEDKLVIFKESAVFVMAGTEADDTGANSSLSSIRLVCTDVGCSEPKSIVRVQDGLVFKAEKGLYKLDLGLALSRVGAAVEDYDVDEITSAVMLEDAHEVRFTTTESRVLVLNTENGQWGTDTEIDAADAILWQGVYTYIHPIGEVRTETPGEYSDCGSPIRRRIVTSWLAFAGLQGYQRLYRLMFLGDYQSQHTLKMSLAYDYDPTPSQEVSLDPTTVITPTYFGSASFFGGDAVFGGEYPLYQFRLHATRQKCQAVQIIIEENQATPSAAGTWSAIAFEIGVKRGLNKRPTATLT
jgi:hypothetical protein